MKIKILYDKKTGNKKLHTGWGVSFLVDGKVLFDTGENGPWLADNMKTLNVDINKIECVVISHDHWDHTGGLWELLEMREGLKVYACPNFSTKFKEKVKKLKGDLIEAKGITAIAKGIFYTGEIAGEYKGEYMAEGALVIMTKNGLSVITGCAHPGAIKIVNTVKKDFPNEDIYAVLGGFHLMDQDRSAIDATVDEFKKIGVKKVGATHCSGTSAEEVFKGRYKSDFIKIVVGQTLDI